MTPDQFSTLFNALLVAQVVTTIGLLLGSKALADVFWMLLHRWPAFRTWRHKQNRIERLELLAWMREHRAAIDAKRVQR